MPFNLKELIRYHRKKSGLSQQGLAQMAGIGKTAIFDVEHGKQSVQWDTLSKILSALNIRVVFDSPLMKSFQENQEGEKL
jgi:transcriptional regulator with XRE-family HTH domain